MRETWSRIERKYDRFHEPESKAFRANGKQKRWLFYLWKARPFNEIVLKNETWHSRKIMETIHLRKICKIVMVIEIKDFRKKESFRTPIRIRAIIIMFKTRKRKNIHVLQMNMHCSDMNSIQKSVKTLKVVE